MTSTQTRSEDSHTSQALTPDHSTAPAAETLAGAAQHPSRIAGADGMRALAALGVMLSHIFQRLAMEQEGWLNTTQGIMLNGAYGVTIFFILSGMLLSLPFWRAYLTGAPRPSLRHYARRRAARIVPGFYVSLVVSFGVGFLIFDEVRSPLLRLFAGLTFTSGFHWLTFFPTEANGPLWSISLEVVSYLLMPLAMLALFALGRRGFRFGAWFWVGVFALVIAVNQVIITTITLSDDGKGWQYGNVGGAKEWVPFYNPWSFFAHFTVGVIVAGVIVWWQLRGGRRLWRFDVIALAGLAGLAGLVWLARFPLEPNFRHSFQSLAYLFPALTLVVGVALVGMAYSRLVGRLMDNRFFRYTATVSFGIYIWHYLILHLVSYLTKGEFEYSGVHNPARFAWMAMVVIVLSYTVATLSWKFIEKPVLNSAWARR